VTEHPFKPTWTSNDIITRKLDFARLDPTPDMIAQNDIIGYNQRDIYAKETSKTEMTHVSE